MPNSKIKNYKGAPEEDGMKKSGGTKVSRMHKPAAPSNEGKSGSRKFKNVKLG